MIKLKFEKSMSDSCPKQIETCLNTVYIRKNIKPIYDGDNNEIISLYTYDEAKLTVDEFNEYISMLSAQNTIKGVNDSDNIAQLVDGQAANGDNQMVVMEAIADLYEMVMGMM